MTQNEDITDAPLMKCAVKKSIDVTKKIAGFVWKLGLVLGVLALLTYVAFVHHDQVNSFLWGAVTYVPWWVYVIVAIPASIGLYSICWCIDRDLTFSDFNSDAAEYNIAIISIIFGIVGYLLMNNILIFVNDSVPGADPAFPYVIIYVISYLPQVFSAFVGFMAFVLIVGFSLDTKEDRGVGRALRFFGAWYHHSKARRLRSAENDSE